MALPDGIDGWCADAFAAVAQVFAAQLASGAHGGAAVGVRHRGAPVVDIWGGGFAEDTLALSFSTTKGPVALALHMVLERGGIGYDTPVSALWPEFGRRGKEAVTIRQCLCHEAGIPQIRDEVADVWAMADWDAMVAMVEGLAPQWEPGSANGYHAITWGWMIGELVRRIDGRPVSQFVGEELAGPLGLDGCFIGTPAGEHNRMALLSLDPAFAVLPRLEELLPPDSLTLRAFSPRGNIVDYVNSAVGRSSCVPAISGAFTARSLATIYSALERGGALGAVRLLSDDTVAAATTVQNTRPDLVLIVPMHWRLGFMGASAAGLGASGAAFGHAGFGGSMAIADPFSELAVAVTLDRLSVDLLGDDRARRIVTAARSAVAALA